MPKPDKKQRHRAKREAKRHDQRRREAVSPMKRLADAPGEIECWMSRDFEQLGQMQIFIYKQGGGVSGIVCFLIDQGVTGLKDVYALYNVPRSELDTIIDRAKQENLPMRRGSTAEARPLILGAARWAHDNGMRLPKGWERFTAIVGGADGWETADVSAFYMEFAGHPEDLRQRLIGQRFEDYVQRKDVAFEFSTEASYKNQESGGYVDPIRDVIDDFEDGGFGEDGFDEESEIPSRFDEVITRLSPAAEALADQTCKWLESKKEYPSPKLPEAWSSLMVMSMAISVKETGTLGNVPLEMLREIATASRSKQTLEMALALDQALAHYEAEPLLMKEAYNTYARRGE